MKSLQSLKRAPSFPTRLGESANGRDESGELQGGTSPSAPSAAPGIAITLRPSYLIELAAFLVVGAFCERELLKTVGQGLEGDSIGYRQIAAHMTHLFDTDIREPIWIWFSWLFDRIWGDNPNSLRLGSMYTFIATDCLVYLLTLQVTKSRLAAVTSFLIFGLNPFLLYLGLTGNRDNMVLFSMTGLTLFSVVREFPRSSRVRLIGLTVFSVLAVGSRLSNFPGVAALLAFAAFRKYFKARFLLVPALAVALFVGPYIAYCKTKFNDAFIASNVHSRWFRNYEFCYVKKTGCNGCTCNTYFNEKGDVVDPYGGGPVTTGEYVFGMHSREQLIALVTLGVSTILFSEGAYFEQLSGFHYNLIYPVYLLGIAALLLSKRRVVLLVPLLSINLVFFTVNMMPARIFSILSPFFALTIAFGAAICVSAVIGLLALAIPRLRPFIPVTTAVWR
ncbi:MAG: glycosyltransferase family 39 protein [Bdellovibrionota bacterium]